MSIASWKPSSLAHKSSATDSTNVDMRLGSIYLGWQMGLLLKLGCLYCCLCSKLENSKHLCPSRVFKDPPYMDNAFTYSLFGICLLVIVFRRLQSRLDCPILSLLPAQSETCKHIIVQTTELYIVCVYVYTHSRESMNNTDKQRNYGYTDIYIHGNMWFHKTFSHNVQRQVTSCLWTK